MNRLKLKIILILGLTFLFLPCLFNANTVHGGFKEKIIIGISSEPQNLNPFFSTDYVSQNINRLVHRALIDVDEKMTIVCDLCVSYKEHHDGKKYRLNFKLKKNLKFDDGSELNSSSVKKSIELFSNRIGEINSVFRFAFSEIKKIKIINTHEIELIYEKYSLDSISNLALLKIVKIIDENVINESIQFKKILGLGSYLIENNSETSVFLKSKRKDAKDLLFKVIKDETTLALKLVKGEIDLATSQLGPRKLLWLENVKNKNKGNDFVFHRKISANYKYLAFNFLNPLLKNKDVRLAISKAIPVDKIIKYKLKGTSVRANSFFSESFSEFSKDNLKLEYNPSMSEELLDRAGHFKDEKGQRFSLDFLVPNQSLAQEVADTMSYYLKKIGINLNVISQEWSMYQRSINKGQFDLFSGQWVGFTGPDILNFVFDSKNIPPKGRNRGRYSNSKLDQLLQSAITETDKDKRVKLYKKSLILINQDLPYFSLWHEVIVWPSRSCINHVNVHPNGSFKALLSIEENC